MAVDACRGCRRTVCAVAFITVFPALAAPVSQIDGAPNPTPAATSLDPAAAAVPQRWGAPEPVGGTNTPVTRGGRFDERPLEAPVSRSPGVPAKLPRRSSTAVAVDEDPRVDTGDVVSSVVRATAASVPWLRLVRAPHDGPTRLPESAQAEIAAELANRLEDERQNRAGADAGRNDGRSPRGMYPNPLQEALEIARDLIANPLTWIVGLPVLLFGFMLLVLRGRSK